jgi:hypothetical protein
MIIEQLPNNLGSSNKTFLHFTLNKSSLVNVKTEREKEGGREGRRWRESEREIEREREREHECKL